VTTTLLHDELDASQKEILRGHVNDLAARVIAKAAAQAATLVPAGHAYVENFVFIVDDISASYVRDGRPIHIGKPYWFR
jgi:hypothetical protein